MESKKKEEKDRLLEEKAAKHQAMITQVKGWLSFQTLKKLYLKTLKIFNK